MVTEDEGYHQSNKVLLARELILHDKDLIALGRLLCSWILDEKTSNYYIISNSN